MEIFGNFPEKYEIFRTIFPPHITIVQYTALSVLRGVRNLYKLGRTWVHIYWRQIARRYFVASVDEHNKAKTKKRSYISRRTLRTAEPPIYLDL